MVMECFCDSVASRLYVLDCVNVSFSSDDHPDGLDMVVASTRGVAVLDLIHDDLLENLAGFGICPVDDLHSSISISILLIYVLGASLDLRISPLTSSPIVPVLNCD